MIRQGLNSFSGKRIILLQGPVGPFFRHLACDLRNTGATVFKVNFNAGDWVFYPHGAINYRGSMEEWPAVIEKLLKSLQIDVIFLFGDCRPVHRDIRYIAGKLGIQTGVFEEGYVRPNYVTLERYGVNGNSPIIDDPESVFRNRPIEIPEENQIGNTFWPMVFWGAAYFTAGGIGRLFFPRYRHHRPLTIREALPWMRSIWRKYRYAMKEDDMLGKLTGLWKKKYFLVPLQVHNDAQITEHSSYRNIREFIHEVIMSFALHAPSDTILVFKHHPMDRGYTDHSKLIRSTSRQGNVQDRVFYLHDQHLPTLLKSARGVTVINSTVGLSAIYHGVPTKVCGKAVYDIIGLTSRKQLDDFWSHSGQERPDRLKAEKFREYLIASTQLNGSFYRKNRHSLLHCGLIWDRDGSRKVMTCCPEPLQEHPHTIS
ncbi:MAG: capsular biosynthesis protein [Chlorobiaceae bacterium]|nr:capsular biosynthesis protein [Chlorobiaceae bacterium]